MVINNCAKTFHDLDEQINKLKSRKMIINEEDKEITKKILLAENYYNVINGYKSPFLIKNINEEMYIENCTFNEVYSLFRFDRELRNLLLKFLLIFETNIKSSIAYHFSEKNTGQYAYLNMDSYIKDDNKLQNVLTVISDLSNEIRRQITKKGSNSVKHYTKNHANVPLWVLVNYLTIGKVSKFYEVLSVDVRNKIAAQFSMEHKKNYESSEKIDSSELQEILKIVNFFRNVCAHEEVLFSYKLDSKAALKYTLFEKFFKSKNINAEELKNGNMFSLVALLKLVLDENTYTYFSIQLAATFNEYRHHFKSVSFDEILYTMGFKETWNFDIFEN